MTTNNTETIEQPDVSEVDMSCLVREWEALIPAKWQELRKELGHFLSVYNPRWTMGEDRHRRQEASKKAMKWTVEWFEAKGVKIECTLCDDGETFGIDALNKV